MPGWITDRAIDGYKKVLQIKQAAINEWSGNLISEITGCGVCVVIDDLDALLKDWLVLRSRCADMEHEIAYRKESMKEWRDIGFDRDPSEYSDERQQELRALARRWNDEDEAEMDAEDMKEIEKRKAKREGREEEVSGDGCPVRSQ